MTPQYWAVSVQHVIVLCKAFAKCVPVKLRRLGGERSYVVALLSPQLTMNDFSVHRIIGRGGFGEVYGCRKADTGKMSVAWLVCMMRET